MDGAGVSARIAVAAAVALAGIGPGAPAGPLTPWLAPAGSSLATTEGQACTAGWMVQPPAVTGSILAGIDSLGDGTLWAVGGKATPGVGKSALAQRWDGAEWHPEIIATGGKDDSLLAVSASRWSAWSVGSTQRGVYRRPLSLRHVDGAWESVPLPYATKGGASLIGIDGSRGEMLAVGQWWSRTGRRPLAFAWDGAAWQRSDPRLAATETGALLGIASVTDGPTWAVGWVSDGTLRQGLILRRVDGAWERAALPDPGGSPETILTDIAVRSPTEAWAVGYRLDGARQRPYVLRWDGSAWTTFPPPMADGDVILRSIEVDEGGTVWVMGTQLAADASAFRAFAASWDGSTWSPAGGLDASESHTGLLDATLMPEGLWLAGQAGSDGLVVRTCDEDMDPAAVSAAVPPPASYPREERYIEGHADEHGSDEEPEEGQEGGHDHDRLTERFLDPEPIPQSNAAPGVPAAVTVTGLAARDVADRVGLTETTRTYGGTVADLDGNGWLDLFISRHSETGRRLLNAGGTFSDVLPDEAPRRDRHGCAAADVDGDGRPDIYCALGGGRGQGLKMNELWLQTADGGLIQSSAPWGVADALGRGRQVSLFDADGDGDPDLYVGGTGDRVDGLPAPNRLFRNDGGRFTAWPEAGLDVDLGARCLDAGDVDGDGRLDLLLCPLSDQAPTSPGLRLYRNLGGRFADITEKKGILPLGEIDSAFADLDGDGWLDLIQLSQARLRVSLYRAKRFEPVYERSVSYGRGLAVGDADGDGRHDVYVVRGTTQTNPRDVMLINDGDGERFTSMAIPYTTEGTGEDVLAIDHDRNGLTDFLILNGLQAAGPIQLIAFFRDDGAPTASTDGPR